MSTSSVRFEAGGFDFLPGVFQYSAGVRAAPGHEIVHARFHSPIPLAAGFAAIAEHLAAIGRPRTAFCACELRSPAPFTEAGFRAFNEAYVRTLTDWGIVRDGVNPIARSNVCPELNPPAEPSFYAFSYTVPSYDAAATAVVAGSGESLEGKASYAQSVVAPGDTSVDGMRRKAAHVVAIMTQRLAGLGMRPDQVSAAQVYTVFPIHALLDDPLHRSGLTGHGLVWHHARPPVIGLDFEMDVRVVRSERLL